MSIELSQIVLNNGLTFLAVVTAIVVGTVGYFLVKLLMDLSTPAITPIENINALFLLIVVNLVFQISS